MRLRSWQPSFEFQNVVPVFGRWRGNAHLERQAILQALHQATRGSKPWLIAIGVENQPFDVCRWLETSQERGIESSPGRHAIERCGGQCGFDAFRDSEHVCLR